jgi:uncharacterized protein YyaL (SSP411 family)
VHELTFQSRWLREARAVADSMVERFWENDPGQFYDTARDAERLIVRPRDVMDNATPAGNSVAAGVLLKLAALTGEADYARIAGTALAALREAFTRYPSACGELLGALDWFIAPVTELTVIGGRDADDTRALLGEAYRRFQPRRLVIGRAPDDRESVTLSPLLEDREQREGRATAYVCVGYTCGAPATDPADLAGQLDVAGTV